MEMFLSIFIRFLYPSVKMDLENREKAIGAYMCLIQQKMARET